MENLQDLHIPSGRFKEMLQRQSCRVKPCKPCFVIMLSAKLRMTEARAGTPGLSPVRYWIWMPTASNLFQNSGLCPSPRPGEPRVTGSLDDRAPLRTATGACSQRMQLYSKQLGHVMLKRECHHHLCPASTPWFLLLIATVATHQTKDSRPDGPRSSRIRNTNW